MRATLFDFYTNTVVLFAWVVYKDRSLGVKALWLILFVGLGSIAVTFYVLLQLFKLKQGEGIDKVLLQPNPVIQVTVPYAEMFFPED